METMTGVVEVMGKDGKRFKLNGGDWFSAFNASQLNGCSMGDEVEFTFVEKGNFKNIKGGVTVKSSGNSSGGSNVSPASAARKSYSRGAFPIDPLDGQRSIIRQNSVTNAVNALSSIMPDEGVETETVDALASTIIKLARKLEAYSAGDLDRLAAMEMANKLDSNDE